MFNFFVAFIDHQQILLDPESYSFSQFSLCLEFTRNISEGVGTTMCVMQVVKEI